MEMKNTKNQWNRVLVLWRDKQYRQTLSQTNQKREKTHTNMIIHEKWYNMYQDIQKIIQTYIKNLYYIKLKKF